MGLTYGVFHALVHSIIVIGISLIFNLNWSGFILVLFAQCVIDLDHIPFLKKRGIKYWFKTAWVSQVPRKYPFHNFLSIIISLVCSILILDPRLSFVGLCFLSITLHLLWDLVEDVFIFKLGMSHWKL